MTAATVRLSNANFRNHLPEAFLRGFLSFTIPATSGAFVSSFIKHLFVVGLSGKILGHKRRLGSDARASGGAMAFTFRYRFVDFGAVFTGAEGIRSEQQGSENPGTVFANELVTDVGGSCFSSDQQSAIIDHHFRRDAQFPAASAAVLHKAKLIRAGFPAHRTEFSGWSRTSSRASTLSARCICAGILEDPAAIIDWEGLAVDPDGPVGLPGVPEDRIGLLPTCTPSPRSGAGHC